MTAQISDDIYFQGKKYGIVSLDSPELLNIDWKKYGIKPTFATTACWAGYWCGFRANKDGVFLTDAYIHCDNDEDYTPIEGILPQPVRYRKAKVFSADKEKYELIPENMGHRHYKGLHIRMQYRGKILLGRDFDDRYYVHMGFQDPFAYKTLIELTYDDSGNLADIKDLSDWAAEKRRENPPEDYLEEEDEKFLENSMKWINDKFDLKKDKQNE